MATSEHDQSHGLGPIADGEEERIVKDAIAFLWLNQRHDSYSREADDYRLHEAPANLVRRFLLQKPAKYGDCWIPFGELPDGLYQRARLADECRRSIFLASNINQPTERVDLTAQDIERIYRHEHWLAIERARTRPPYDFDLSDVYVCAEGRLLQLYERRDHPDPDEWEQQGIKIATQQDWDMIYRHYHDLSRQTRSILVVIGQAVSEPGAKTQAG